MIRIRLIAAMILSLSTLPHTSSAEPVADFREYEIKAVYLLNFASFVFWPDAMIDHSESFNICILGEDPFGSNLDITIENERISNLPVTLQRLLEVKPEFNCHIIFFSQSLDINLSALLSTLSSHPILTISDRDDFIQQGGMIELVNSEDNQVRFKVKASLIENSHLQISTDLLEIAELVE